MAGITLTSQSQQTVNGKLIKVAERQGNQQCKAEGSHPVSLWRHRSPKFGIESSSDLASGETVIIAEGKGPIASRPWGKREFTVLAHFGLR
jgi:hypothetical protein